MKKLPELHPTSSIREIVRYIEELASQVANGGGGTPGPQGDPGTGLTLQSPDGSSWNVTVSDDGTLSATPA